MGDFDGDGISDLAVANYNSEDVSILIGVGDGTFNLLAPTYASGSSAWSIAVGDLNGNGIPDLAVANLDGNNVAILLGVGDGTFNAAVNYPPGALPYSVAVGDFNGDGYLDIAVVEYDGDDVSILLNAAAPPVTPVTPPAAGTAYPVWAVLLAGIVGGIGLLMLRRRSRVRESV